MLHQVLHTLFMLTKHFPYATSFICGNRSKPYSCQYCTKALPATLSLTATSVCCLALTYRRRRMATCLSDLLVRNLRQKQSMWKCLLHKQLPYILHSSKSLLPMLTVITHVTPWCWCSTASSISYEAYITTTKAICQMGHNAAMCLWFHKFLAIKCVLQGFHQVKKF
jgi:hypothetical protein